MNTQREMTDLSLVMVFNIHSYNRKVYLLITAYFWFITREISNSGLREFSTVRKDGRLDSDLDWQYNRYPDCETVRWFLCQLIIWVSKIWTFFHSGYDVKKKCVFPFFDSFFGFFYDRCAVVRIISTVSTDLLSKHW